VSTRRPLENLAARPASYRDEPGFAIRIALAGSGPQVELIEPQRGPSIYEEWIAEHGHGRQHGAGFGPRA
jgi:methylmalonyl-CoA/ethylmalonyl-CoA epimerase